jgi:hypothetical protein
LKRTMPGTTAMSRGARRLAAKARKAALPKSGTFVSKLKSMFAGA